jgi:uncharacterized membrane protein
MGAFVKKHHLSTLLLIIAFGLILRLYDLGTESIWLDEGYSIHVSKLDFFQLLKLEDDFPPLYYLLLHGWIKLFGDSEFSVRFPSLIFGVLSIGALYQVGTLLFDIKRGLIAGFLLAVSSFHIHYCQEARPYSLMVFLALCSMYGFIKCNKQWQWTSAAGYVLSSTLLIYSHVIGLFLLAAQNLYFLTQFLFCRNELNLRLKQWVVMQCVVGLLFLPWLPIFITQLAYDRPSAWLTVPGINDIRLTLRSYVGGHIFKLSPLLVLASIITMNAIKLTGGWAALFKSLFRLKLQIRYSDLRQNYLVLLWLSCPIAIPLILSQIMSPLYHTRYTIAAVPAIYLLLASGIGNMRHVAVRALVIGFIAFISLINVFSYYDKTTKIDWRNIAQHIEQFALPEDMLIHNCGNYKHLVFDYYFDSNKLDRIVAPEGLERVHQELLKEWTDHASRHKRVWAVLTKYDDEIDQISQSLGRTHEQIYTLNYQGFWLYLFQHRSFVQSAVTEEG